MVVTKGVLFDRCLFVSGWRLGLWRLIVCLSFPGGGASPDLRPERFSLVFMAAAFVDLPSGPRDGRHVSWTSSVSFSRCVCAV